MINLELRDLTEEIDNKIINNINHPEINYYFKYLCNILDKYDIFINDYLIKLNICLKGYLDIFKDCYIYGDILYDILTYKPSKLHYKVKIFLKPITDIKYIKKFIEQYKIIETKNYIIYMINDIEFHLYKNYINPLEILIKNKNNDNNFLLVDDKILTHPINYYKLYNINDVYINNIDENKTTLINKIYNNKFNEIEINKDNLDLILNVSISLSKKQILIDKCLDLIIENNMKDYFKKNNILFNAIKKNNLYIFEKITKSKIEFDLDILNKEGYNLIEYCLINLNDTTKKIIELIKKYKYSRNPAYIDFILKRNIIDKKIKYEYEKIFYEEITKLQINNCDNIQLINNIIINSMYNVKEGDYKIDLIIDFIRFNYKFINKSLLFRKLEQKNSIVVVKNLFIEKIININDNENIFEILKLICYFKLHNYLQLNKKYVKLYSYKLLQFCIDINNIESFVCILLLDNYNIYSKDEYNNNILHYICDNNNLDKIELFIKVCIKYNENIFNLLNDRKENCLYNCVDNDNINAFKFLLTYKIKNNNDIDTLTNSINDNYINLNIDLTNKNIEGKNILFYIIEKNKIEFLRILFENYNYVNLLINSRDNFNNTPIIYASKKKNIEFINYLYKFNPNLDLYDNNNNYIYHYIGLYALITDIKNIKNKKNKNNKSTIDYLNYYIYNLSNF